MSINLVHAVNAAVTEDIAEQLAQQFGIPANILRQLVAPITLALMATLVDRASLTLSARQLYFDHHAARNQCLYRGSVRQDDLETTGELKHLEGNGHQLATEATGKRIDFLTDAVSSETGVPSQATSALAGIVAAVLFGIVKRHFLLAQWGLPQLPLMLHEQVGDIKVSLSNAVAAAIGVGNTDNFTHSVGARLGALVSALAEREEAQMPPALFVADAGANSEFAAVSPVAASRPLTAPVRKAAPAKRSNKAIWMLFAVLAAILASCTTEASRKPATSI